MPYCIPDDPIIRCIERTGYPPWFNYITEDEYDEVEEEDEEIEDEESSEDCVFDPQNPAL